MKINQDIISIIVKRQVQSIIIVDSTIYRIIELQVITNTKSIVMIEQQNNLLIELVVIKKKCEKMVVLIVEYHHPT